MDIDVSKCEHFVRQDVECCLDFTAHNFDYCEVYYNACKDNNCYYKQLQQANAKIEDIKKRTILAKDINGWYKDQCDGALSCYTLCNDILRIIESKE